MMFQVTDIGTSCEIGDVPVPSSSDDNQNNIELQRKKKARSNNPETEADFSSDHSCLVAHVTASNFLPQDFTSSNGLERNFCKKYSPISSYSSSEKQNITFTLACVDGRNCRLRLPMQFTKENGINKPGKIYLLGKDGSKWLANLLMESRGRMTLGDGWKSFVKANGLKTGESITLKLNWENTTPVLSLYPSEYSIDTRARGGCSEAIDKESLPIQPSSEKEINNENSEEESSSWERDRNHLRWRDSNSPSQNRFLTLTATPGGCSEAIEKESLPIQPSSEKEINNENSEEESSSWERDRNHLRWRDSNSPSQNRFLTLTATPDSLKHGRLRLPLQFMRDNSMNTPGEITLLGKDGAKWLASLLLERRGRMSLGKGWKDFAKANDLMTGDSFTLEAIWEDAIPMLSLFNTESSRDRRQQGECSKASEKESLLTEPSCEYKTEKAENNREESIKHPPRRKDLSSAIQNRFTTVTFSPEIVRCVSHHLQIGEDVVFRHKEDMMFQVSELRPSCCEIRDVAAPSRNNDQENIDNIWMKKDADPRKESYFSSNEELQRKKKMKNNNPETEADFSSAHSCIVSHVTASNLRTDALYLPQDFTCSNGLKRKCCKKDSPRRIFSSYSSSQKQFVTFTLAPVDVRHCRLRLPVQFTRENCINKPGKIYLVGKDGSKWLANLLLESRGRMTLGDGWKSFVKANSLKTGESYTLRLDWEDTTPVLCLCPPENNIDRRAGGGYSQASEKEFHSLEPSSGKEISKDDNSKEENSKEESSSWEREKNHLSWRASASPNQNRFLTITITPDCLKHGRLRIPLQFMTENSMNKPGEITLLGKDGAKWLASLLLERRGRMSLGKGWKDFAKANGLKTGDSITLESVWEDATPVLSLLRIVSSNDRGQSEISKEPHSTELSSGNKNWKAENNREESSSGELEKRKYIPRRRDSFSVIQKRYVILTLTPENVRGGQLHLPSQFMRANGINKLGKLTLLGKDGLEWLGYLLSKDGTVALGCGWKDFCEANGVRLGEYFTLEFIPKEENNLVFKFYSNSRGQIHKS